MTPSAFRAACAALYQGRGDWQAALAHHLSVDKRSVRRWCSETGDGPPDWVIDKLGIVRDPAVPRDEWILALRSSEDGRDYVIHTRAPRFVGRLVDVDGDGLPEPDELPADVTGGITMDVGEGIVLCEIAWGDPPPTDADIVALLGQVRDVILDGA